MLCIKEPIRCILVYVLYCACKFFKWLDTRICCTRGAAATPIVIAKFKWLEHAVEVANEESKQAHALTVATLERERVAKRKAEKAKVARMIYEEKAKKLTIALVVSWAFNDDRLFPLFTTGLALDDDRPSTSIGSTFVEGWHYESTNSLLSIEFLDPSVHSFGISPLVQNAFFPVTIVPSNMTSMDRTFGKGLFLKGNALGHAYMWTTSS